MEDEASRYLGQPCPFSTTCNILERINSETGEIFKGLGFEDFNEKITEYNA